MSLEDLVRGLDSRAGSDFAFFDLLSRELLFFTRADLDLAESEILEDDLPPVQRDKVAKIRDYLGEPERFVALPDADELDERSIMEEFCDSVENADIQREMLRALRGKAAARRFQEVVHAFKLGLAWQTYRLEALRDLIEEWCEEQGIRLELGVPYPSR